MDLYPNSLLHCRCPQIGRVVLQQLREVFQRRKFFRGASEWRAVGRILYFNIGALAEVNADDGSIAASASAEKEGSPCCLRLPDQNFLAHTQFYTLR